MTDRSDPRAPKSSRKKPKREPATIDLKATVIDDGSQQEVVRDEVMTPEETISPESERQAEDTVASPEATLDSGTGTDSIGPQDTAQATLGEETLGPDTLRQDASGQDIPPQAPPYQAPPAQEPPARRTSAGALIGTSILGGLIGAGLVYGVQTWMTPDPQGDQRLVQLEQRVSALSQQGPQQGLQQGDLQGVQDRLQSLESADATLDQRLQAIQNTAEQAVARADEALNRPAPQSPAPETNQALNEAFNRLSALENQVQSGAQEAANRAQAAQETANALQSLQPRLSELESRLSGQDQRLGELNNQLNQRLENLSAQLNQRLAELSDQAAQRDQGAQSTQQAGIRVVLAERLGDALNNGNPYPDVLEGLRRFEADPSRIAPLEPFAQSGAPTATALAQSFEPLAASILRESRGPANGWSDRVLRMVDRVVTVRPVDEPGSSGVAGLVARIEQALERGDVAAAAQAWQSLPEPARQLSDEWGRQVTAVAQANQASKAIADNALAALNRSAQ